MRIAYEVQSPRPYRSFTGTLLLARGGAASTILPVPRWIATRSALAALSPLSQKTRGGYPDEITRDYGAIAPETMRRVDEALRVALAL